MLLSGLDAIPADKIPYFFYMVLAPDSFKKPTHFNHDMLNYNIIS